MLLFMLCSCDAVESKLVALVRKNETLVVIGETGSGKTTRKCITFIEVSNKFLSTCKDLLFLF